MDPTVHARVIVPTVPVKVHLELPARRARSRFSVSGSPDMTAGDPRWYARRMHSPPPAGPYDRPLRVAHVVDQLALAGMEYGVVKLVNRLDPRRIRSVIVCMRHRVGNVSDLLSDEVPVFELRKRPGRNWSVIGRLASRFREERIDIVHSHNWSTFLYSVAAARLAGVPVAVHGEHGKDDTLRDARRILASRILARGVARVCAVSRDLAEEVVRDWGLPPERVARIPNGVDLDSFDGPPPSGELRRELGLAPDDRVVMNTGGFRTIKDHPTLLRAFAIVRREDPAVRLLLVGTGSPEAPRAGLDRLAEDLGIADAVRFAGVRHDVPRVLRICDVYVNSSRFEGMSNTILEAMAAGKPVVATDVGGNPELVQEGVTGYLVPAGEEAPMAARLGALLRDSSLRDRMGAAGRGRIEAEHSMSGMVRAYTELYESTWSERGTPRRS
jgi:sugar transferase (PEP-CTERM/EpsH1 system associated)